jgi:hypothetical protein
MMSLTHLELLLAKCHDSALGFAVQLRRWAAVSRMLTGLLRIAQETTL